MAISLYSATVSTYLQALPKVAALIDKAEAHCGENGLGDDALSAASLAPDQWNFARQVSSTCHHSAGAIEGVRAGVFMPDLDPAPTDFASLKAHVAKSIALLEAVDPGELDAIQDRDMRFEFGTRRMDFTVEGFLLSFSIPNFFFHAATAFSVLRNQGLPLGKMDYLGMPRLKG